MQKMLATIVALGCFAGSAGWLLACDTPVYRYAMYRWQPSKYELYCFHEGERPESFGQIQTKLEKLKLDGFETLNVSPYAVNISDPAELDRMPPGIVSRWKGDAETGEPGYLLVNPKGIVVYQGTLDGEAFGKLAMSPLRKEVISHLGEGKLGVLVFVEGKDKEASAAAEKMTSELVKSVNSGETKVSPQAPPGAEVLLPPDAPSSEKAADAKQPQVAMIKITRDQAGEEWFWRMLESVEADLHKFDEPMVFTIFGRGRVLEPYIGAGITKENLLRELSFVSGPCSCTVKDQNPGVDLLMQNDWEMIAEKLTEMFGAEEGNEAAGGGDDFFPELLLPGAGELVAETQDGAPSEFSVTEETPEGTDRISDKGEEASDEKSEETSDDGGDAKPDDATTTNADANFGGNAEADPSETTGVTEADPKEETSEKLASRTDPEAADGKRDQEQAGGMLMTYIVLGFAATIIGLFFATVLILRPRN